MKKSYKKIIAIVLLAVISISMVKFTFAFTKMDICNYTHGDSSGDYYDRKCTKDGKPAENDYIYLKQQEAKRLAELARQAQKKEERKLNHKLNHVDAYDGSATFIGKRNTKIEKLQNEINNLKKNISVKNKLISNYKKVNLELIRKNIVLLNENKKLKARNKDLQNFINTFKETFKNSNSQKIIDEEARKRAIKEKIRQRIIERNKKILGIG